MKRHLQRLNKKVVAGATVALGAVSSQAAVATPLSYSTATGFAGSIDMTSYGTGVGVVVGVFAIVIATTLGLKALKGAKSV